MESIFAIIGIFFLPIIMVMLIAWFKSVENRQRNQLQAELFAKAIEKGQALPENFFVQPKKKGNPLNTGIICIAIGLGVSLSLWVTTSVIDSNFDNLDQLKFIAAIGIIPLFIGSAYLVIYYIEKKQSEKKNAQ